VPQTGASNGAGHALARHECAAANRGLPQSLAAPQPNYSVARLRAGMSCGRSVHLTSGHTCTRDLKRQPFAVFTRVSS